MPQPDPTHGHEERAAPTTLDDYQTVLAEARRVSAAHGSAGPLCGIAKRGRAGRTQRTSRAPQDVSDRRRMR